MKKRICIDMSATLFHHGHIRLINRAKKKFPNSKIIALTSDKDILEIKGYVPELNFLERKEILLNIKGVDDVIMSDWKINEKFMRENNLDLLIHGDDNSNDVKNIHVFERTKAISSSDLRLKATRSLVQKMNRNKIMFTPGPAQLSYDSVLDLIPAFGRGDNQYKIIEENVLNSLKDLTKKQEIIRLQVQALMLLN